MDSNKQKNHKSEKNDKYLRLIESGIWNKLCGNCGHIYGMHWDGNEGTFLCGADSCRCDNFQESEPGWDGETINE